MADDVIRDVSSQTPAGTRLVERLNLSKVSWGAIWAGVMVTIGMEALFLSFGIFIGGVFGGSVVWSMAWYLVTMAVSFYAGAWCASRLSDVPGRQLGVLHGLTTWGLATLGTVLIGGVVAWAALRLGIILAVSGTTGAVTVNTSAIWGATEKWGGLIWGGVFLSLITAYLGGASGIPSQRVAVGQETPAAPTRLAA